MIWIKEQIERFHISIAIVGSAVVLGTMFGECSYDWTTGDVEIGTSPGEIAEAIKGDK
jgi:hypothetical protein|tara:strand:- start:519 stop:692 length:174 start_codon:yes stop_codon:yes gene_type:complete